MFIGLVVGVMRLRFGVVWYLNNAPPSFMNKYEGAPSVFSEKTRRRLVSGAAATPAAPAPSARQARRQAVRTLRVLRHPRGQEPGTTRCTCAGPRARTRRWKRAPRAGRPGGDLLPRGVSEGGRRRQPEGKLALTGWEASVQEEVIPTRAPCTVSASVRSAYPRGMNRRAPRWRQSGVARSQSGNNGHDPAFGRVVARPARPVPGPGGCRT